MYASVRVCAYEQIDGAAQFLVRNILGHDDIFEAKRREREVSVCGDVWCGGAAQLRTLTPCGALCGMSAVVGLHTYVWHGECGSAATSSRDSESECTERRSLQWLLLAQCACDGSVKHTSLHAIHLSRDKPRSIMHVRVLGECAFLGEVCLGCAHHAPPHTHTLLHDPRTHTHPRQDNPTSQVITRCTHIHNTQQGTQASRRKRFSHKPHTHTHATHRTRTD